MQIINGIIIVIVKKRGGREGGLNGGVVHFIAGIKDEYNKITFMDLQNNNIVFAVKGLNPGVISKVGWVWSYGWTKSWIGLLLLTVSHPQSQSELYHVSWWYYTLVIDLIGQLRRDVIGRL